MKLNIPYGKSSVAIKIADDRLAEIVQPNPVPIADGDSVITDALNHPANAPRLEDFLADGSDVLFIVNDATRPTPTARILTSLDAQLDLDKTTFIVATGIHRAPSEEEYRWLFGNHYDRYRSRTVSHNSKQSQDMVYLGTSTNGTPMEVNRIGVEASKIVIIGSVEPHYFAGYTGGRKAFLPGIAAYKTIEANHKHALHLNAKALALEGNPVHEDMMDALKTIDGKDIFAIMTVLDRDHNIYAATAGHIHDSFVAAIAKANEVFSVPIKQKADIVVSVAPFPMDIDLYQSQKALDNGKLALKEDGILILVSKCRTGVGNDDFVRLLSQCSTPKDALARIDQQYVLGYHKAAKMAEIGLWAQTWAVTDLEDDLLRSVFLEPYHDLQGALDAAITEKGPNAKVLFLLNGSITVPRVV